jgi:hypothetical protein
MNGPSQNLNLNRILQVCFSDTLRMNNQAALRRTALQVILQDHQEI